MIRPLLASVKHPCSIRGKPLLSISSLKRIVPDANYQLARRGPPTMSFSQPRASDVELMRYMRDHASKLDGDNLLLQWLQQKADYKKEAEDALEKYGHACGVVYAIQLIREYGSLNAGRVKR
jgi:hypothetical protein